MPTEVLPSFKKLYAPIVYASINVAHTPQCGEKTTSQTIKITSKADMPLTVQVSLFPLNEGDLQSVLDSAFNASCIKNEGSKQRHTFNLSTRFIAISVIENVETPAAKPTKYFRLTITNYLNSSQIQESSKVISQLIAHFPSNAVLQESDLTVQNIFEISSQRKEFVPHETESCFTRLYTYCFPTQSKSNDDNYIVGLLLKYSSVKKSTPLLDSRQPQADNIIYIDGSSIPYRMVDYSATLIGKADAFVNTVIQTLLGLTPLAAFAESGDTGLSAKVKAEKEKEEAKKLEKLKAESLNEDLKEGVKEDLKAKSLRSPKSACGAPLFLPESKVEKLKLKN